MAAICEKDFALHVGSQVGDLMAYWTLDENSGATGGNRVDMAQGIVLTPSGGITWTTAGKISRAAEFPTGFFLNPTIESQFSEPLLAYVDIGITFFGWLRIDNLDPVPATIVLDSNYNFKNGAATTNQIFWSYETAINSFHFEVDGIATVNHVQGLEDTNYHFFVLWYDPSDRKARVQIDDGAVSVSAASIPAPIGNLNAGFLEIFGDASGNTGFRLDEFGIFNGVLTTSQRSYLYNSGNGRTWPDVNNLPP